MKRRLLALIGCTALLLGSCALGGPEESGPPEGSYGVYYAVTDRERSAAAVDCQYYTLPSQGPPVAVLMSLLMQQPGETGLASPFPSGVRLLSWELEEGRLHLDLSEQYSGLSGVGLTVADYCIALTMCQVEGVESVYITVEGEEMPFRQTQLLEEGDVILSGAGGAVVHLGIDLWFPRAQGDGLGVEHRQILKTEDDTLREVVLSAWLAGPEYQSLTSWVPEGTEIRAVEIEEDGVCCVNLSAAFRDSEPEDPRKARLLLYALVNTVGGLETVESVRILIEGELLAEYGGMTLIQPLFPDPALEK